MKKIISKELNKRIYFAGLRISKEIIHKFNMPVKNPAILFITGCQRSGTTLMYEIFQKDISAKVFPEFSKLSDPGDREKLRMLPLYEVKKIFENSRTSFIISKPLVESQNLDKLLDFFAGSKAIWMIRDYKSVAKSNIKHFGSENGVRDLTPIIERERNNWRSERVSDEVFKIIKQYYSRTMDPYDAAALFWFVRNSLYFDLNLNERKNVILFSYEDLIEQPANMIKSVYGFMKQEYPGDRIIKDIHSEAVDRGKMITINRDIDHLCNALFSKMKAQLMKQITQDINIENIILQKSNYLPR